MVAEPGPSEQPAAILVRADGRWHFAGTTRAAAAPLLLRWIQTDRQLCGSDGLMESGQTGGKFRSRWSSPFCPEGGRSLNVRRSSSCAAHRASAALLRPRCQAARCPSTSLQCQQPTRFTSTQDCCLSHCLCRCFDASAARQQGQVTPHSPGGGGGCH
ncbi:unnamed protein product [Pleuronectes platessa]|uniref:Uncharacterized protein n=1 Tax=Pleuronectes platessa TaxID=8262 RepID=A0A9N7Y631_PLEPL|nr:unnamed protein product [Pleuronectes platessa]